MIFYSQFICISYDYDYDYKVFNVQSKTDG